MTCSVLQALDEFATKLIQNKHYAKEDVATRRDAVSAPRSPEAWRSRLMFSQKLLLCLSAAAQPPERPAPARPVPPSRPGGLIPPAAVLQGLGRAEELDQREDEDGHG